MNRKTARLLTALMPVYLLVVALGTFVVASSMKENPPPMPRRITLCLAPLIAMATAVIFMVRAYANVDERERKIQIEALAIAFAGTAFLTLLCGQLQFIQAGVPAINWAFIWPLMAVIWTLSYLAVKIRYR